MTTKHKVLGSKSRFHILEIKDEYDDFVIEVMNRSITKTEDGNEIFVLSLSVAGEKPVAIFLTSETMRAIAEALGKIADGEFKNGNTTGTVPPGT
jgi:hypothetical protein